MFDPDNEDSWRNLTKEQVTHCHSSLSDERKKTIFKPCDINLSWQFDLYLFLAGNKSAVFKCACKCVCLHVFIELS